MARQFGVSKSVVYYWIARKIFPARRLNGGTPYWITINGQKRKQLKKVGQRVLPNRITVVLFRHPSPNAY